jgi:light-regulated signal transduction histidine kinase (bacteriophytochrome)
MDPRHPDRPDDAVYADLSRLNSELVTLQRDLSQRNAQLTALTLELEERVAERTRHLAEANEELETLAYAMAHDLRAPARHVDGLAALLEEASSERLAAREREWLALMRRAASRQSALIEDILGYLRLGSARLVRQPIDMAEKVSRVIDELGLQPAAARVEWQVQALPPASGDPALVTAILRNLLDNAVKFSARSAAPAITIGADATSTPVAYFVRDNGVGFDPARARQMFKPFERLHAETQFSGLGIGLAIVKRLVSRHGGRVWAHSQPGDGATFHFTLGAA